MNNTTVFGAVIVLTVTIGITFGDWSSECPPGCKCKWVSGKKFADCKRNYWHAIPETLSNEIQIIDLSGNQIDRLPGEAFKSVNLNNLHRINLQDSQIKEIARDAFKELRILVDIDLSENRISVLHPGTFTDNVLLKTLVLNKNPLKVVPDGLFVNLFHLQKLELSDCILSEIEDNAFHNVSNLLDLKLDGNKLSRVKLKTFSELRRLRSFVFQNNPWHCDCRLRNFRNWVIERNLLSEPTLCVTPEVLVGRLWKDISGDEFACRPDILWPPVGSMVVLENNLSLGCNVAGDPLPQVQWLHNGRIVSEGSTIKYNANRYTIKHSNSNGLNGLPSEWVNLTVHDVDINDKGQFTCTAQSPGGQAERNITLLLDGDSGGIVGVGYNNESWPLIIGLFTGLTALLIIICVLVCCCCCRKRQSKAEKSVSFHSDKQEESLLAVNPIQKPPRCYDTQISPHDEAIETSELNTKLLDNNSLHGTVTSEGNQSAECLDSLHEAHPPDLLSFPSRRYNISPAGSATSKGYDSMPRSLLSPGVHSLQNPAFRYNFGTLPYSRSHSPLTPGPIVHPRQGYVTIPRRPRIPSWSSAPTPSLLDDPLSPILAEPIYDNLGPRTTADGSSVLSLNKSIPENPRKKKTPHTPYYFHFESPCPSPLAANDKDNTKEIKKSLLAKISNTETSPAKKIAPKPPPKPKKGGPLFEDEGEDGTEV